MAQQTDDLEWFAARPYRSYRVRAPFDGEIAERLWAELLMRKRFSSYPGENLIPFIEQSEREGFRIVYLIIQFRPGLRSREVARVPGDKCRVTEQGDPLDKLTDEQIVELFPSLAETGDSWSTRTARQTDQPMPVKFPYVH